MRLTSRLDGYTASDVIGAIDRAQKVFVRTTAQYVVMDNDPNAPAAPPPRMPSLKDKLALLGQAYVYDNTTAAVTAAPGPVLGYISHGVNSTGGALQAGYVGNQFSSSCRMGPYSRRGKATTLTVSPVAVLVSGKG